jgi:hypothetical protein
MTLPRTTAREAIRWACESVPEAMAPEVDDRQDGIAF